MAYISPLLPLLKNSKSTYKFESAPLVIVPTGSPDIPPTTLRPNDIFFSEVLGNSATPPNNNVWNS